MRALSLKDIESEISYAYLHAVASHAGAGCSYTNRAADGNGIDAVVTGWGPFPGGGNIEEVDIKVQLKATVGLPRLKNGFLSYELDGIARYDDLRREDLATPRIRVVLFLPLDLKEWLSVSESELILKKCAYWVGLKGARSSANMSSQTVYIPQRQIFDEDNLRNIFARLSRNETLTYLQP